MLKLVHTREVLWSHMLAPWTIFLKEVQNNFGNKIPNLNPKTLKYIYLFVVTTVVGDCFLTFYIAICTSRVARKKKNPLFTVTKKNAFFETLLFKLIVFKSQFSSQPSSLLICNHYSTKVVLQTRFFFWLQIVYDRNHFFGLGSDTETETENWPKL